MPIPKPRPPEPDSLHLSVPKMLDIKATGRGIDEVRRLLPLVLAAAIAGALLVGGGVGLALLKLFS